MKKRVTLVGGPMDGQSITTTVWRMEFPDPGFSEAGGLVHVYDVRQDNTAAYRGAQRS